MPLRNSLLPFLFSSASSSLPVLCAISSPYHSPLLPSLLLSPYHHHCFTIPQCAHYFVLYSSPPSRSLPFSLLLCPNHLHCFTIPHRVPLCYLMLEGRKDPSKVGLMYLCTFTLLKLSGERVFGVSLNQPYQLTLPVDVPPFTG
jgi:Dyggve-Melchior-Clausen syndrome protein